MVGLESQYFIINLIDYQLKDHYLARPNTVEHEPVQAEFILPAISSIHPIIP